MNKEEKLKMNNEVIFSTNKKNFQKINLFFITLDRERAEIERLEIIRRQEEYEEAERRRYEEENLRREQELALAIEQARRMAEEQAEREAENERRTQFMNLMKREQALFDINASVSRAFVFSYYDLMKFLGCEITGPRNVQFVLDGSESQDHDQKKKKKK